MRTVITALRYKHAIKLAIERFDSQFDEDIIENFSSKDFPEFWKCWKQKCRRYQTKNAKVSGFDNDKDTVDGFAKHFQAVYFDSALADEAKKDFDTKYNAMSFDKNANLFMDLVNVELVDKCLHNMKLGKTGGLDELTAEHLVYTHPYLVVLLCDLYRFMADTGFVPDAFGRGLIDSSGCLNDLNNYRAITISPVISKLFELILLKVCNCYLASDE